MACRSMVSPSLRSRTSRTPSPPDSLSSPGSVTIFTDAATPESRDAVSFAPFSPGASRSGTTMTWQRANTLANFAATFVPSIATTRKPSPCNAAASFGPSVMSTVSPGSGHFVINSPVGLPFSAIPLRNFSSMVAISNDEHFSRSGPYIGTRATVSLPRLADAAPNALNDSSGIFLSRAISATMSASGFRYASAVMPR